MLQFLATLRPVERPSSNDLTQEERALLSVQLASLHEHARQGVVAFAGFSRNAGEERFLNVVFHAGSEEDAWIFVREIPGVKEGALEAQVVPYLVLIERLPDEWRESQISVKMTQQLAEAQQFLDQMSSQSPEEAERTALLLYERSRSQTLETIRQRNNLAQMVEDAGKRIHLLEEKEEAARSAGDMPRAEQMAKEKRAYQSTRTSAQKSLDQVNENVEAVKHALRRQRDALTHRGILVPEPSTDQ